MFNDKTFQNSKNQTFSLKDLPELCKVFEKSISLNSFEALSQFTKTCFLDLPSLHLELPKEMIKNLTKILKNLKFQNEELYTPCLSLLNILLNTSNVQVSQILISCLFGFLILNNIFEEILAEVLLLDEKNEIVLDFFVLIKSIIYTYQIPEIQANKLAEFLLKESLIYDTSLFDLSLSCVSALLRSQKSVLYEKLLISMKKISSFSVLLKILESVQDVLQESDTKKHCQINFIQAGILKTLKEILVNNKTLKNIEKL